MTKRADQVILRRLVSPMDLVSMATFPASPAGSKTPRALKNGLKFIKERMGQARFSYGVASAVLFLMPTMALAQDMDNEVAKAEAPAAPSSPLTTPGMTGPLKPNPSPTKLDAGPLGDVYITGVVSGLGYLQNREIPGDKSSRVDLSNGQVFIQKVDGPIQFFVQAGAYSLPSLGTPYVKAKDAIDLTYGIVPQAFLKIAPSEHFNVMVGKLPTLQGAEYTFTFENMNINRGLLWNQENAVTRGIQANLSLGKLNASISFNDGYYSEKYNSLSALVSYAVSPGDTVSIVASGNVGETRRSSFANPLLQNNGELYNLIYTHSAGSLTITPYLQYTRIPRNAALGIDRSGGTLGGAVLAHYKFTSDFSLAGRAEYISSRGGRNSGRPNLLYGPGSDAFSLTITPTFQRGIFFARGELAYVGTSRATPGFAFGTNFDRRSQTRGVLEMGFLF